MNVVMDGSLENFQRDESIWPTLLTSTHTRTHIHTEKQESHCPVLYAYPFRPITCPIAVFPMSLAQNTVASQMCMKQNFSRCLPSPWLQWRMAELYEFRSSQVSTDKLISQLLCMSQSTTSNNPILMYVHEDTLE